MSIIFRDRWLRMERYELREQENGLYICPAAKAERHIYNPFEVSDLLLLEFINLGWLESHGKCSSEAVLSFVQSYGMLGFMTSIIRKEYEDGSIKLYPNNFVTDAKALTMEEYFSLILPQVKSPAHFFHITEKMPVTMLMTGHNSCNQWYLLRHERYSEQVLWITTFAAHLYRLVEQTQHGVPLHYELGNVCAALTSESGQTPRLTWRFDSLKSAIDILLIQELTAERRALRLCKRCGKAFKAENPETEYCGASCRNAENVKLSRARARERCADKK